MSYLTWRKYEGNSYQTRKAYIKAFGKRPPKHKHVHHKDFNSLNNAPENLVVLTQSKHIKLHAKNDPNWGITQYWKRIGDMTFVCRGFTVKYGTYYKMWKVLEGAKETFITEFDTKEEAIEFCNNRRNILTKGTGLTKQQMIDHLNKTDDYKSLRFEAVSTDESNTLLRRKCGKGYIFFNRVEESNKPAVYNERGKPISKQLNQAREVKIMKQETAKTTVMFRKFREGDVVAMFPEIQADMSKENCQSYQHIGQHGAASYQLVNDTRLATPEEYADLKLELEQIGYNLDIRQRITKKWF